MVLTFLNLTITLLVLILGLCTIFLYRNQFTCDIRIRFVKEDMYLYELLPPYDDMLYSPKFWHIWSYEAWVQYVERENLLNKIRRGERV